MSLPAPSPDSTALVTGASSGIGAEFARALARRGYGLTLTARREGLLEELAAELRTAHGVRVEVVPCDLADPAARDGLVAAVERRGLTVEILVNNAGFGVYRDFAETDRERELEQVRVLVEAPVDLTARWLPGMVSRGRGAVINLSSTSGLQPIPGSSTYAAAKAHVLFWSEALWQEVKDRGVTVTAVLPGPVRTGFQEASDATFAEKMPGFTYVPAAQVAEDSLRAAEKGKRTIIPGAVVRAAFAPNRFAPKRVALEIGKRLMAK